MTTEGKVYTNIDFQENEVMPLLHGTLQLFYMYRNTCVIHE